MSFITRMLKQTCVYWPLGSEESGGVDVDNYGQLIYASPVELKCRWDDEVMEVLDAQGTIFISHAKLYIDRDVSIGGVLMLGTLDDVEYIDDPKANEGAYEIKAFLKNPNLKATEFSRTAVL